MHPAPAGNRTITPFPPRGTPTRPDIFTITMATEVITFPLAVARLDRAAGLLPEPAEHD
jgi:hypothetical protein